MLALIYRTTQLHVPEDRSLQGTQDLTRTTTGLLKEVNMSMKIKTAIF
jgi:hypothetical protein